MADRVVSLKNMIFASDAETIIPPIPTAGTPYRNTEFDQEEAAQGWPFDSLVDSAQFNQYLYQLSNIVDQLERTGILLWCNQTDYIIGGICKDDTTGLYYEALDESGPNNGGAKQPSTNIGTYWKLTTFNLESAFGTNVVFTSINYTAKHLDLIFCQVGCTITLPASPADKDRVKIAASKNIAVGSSVTITGGVIQQVGVTSAILDRPVSYIDLVYDSANSLWAIHGVSSGEQTKVSGSQIRLVQKANNNFDNLDLNNALANLGFAQSLTANGYIKLPGGVLIQWGKSTAVLANATVDVAFPLEFTELYALIPGSQYASGTGGCELAALTQTQSVTGATFQARRITGDSADSIYVNWLAIGR